MTEPAADGASLPECLACGACCHGDDGWVHVDADDDARVASDPVLAALVVVTTRGSMPTHSLRMIDGACGALRKESGMSACAAYAARPTVCRALERGSPACHAARAQRV